MAVSYSCNDFFEFQDALKKMRDLDDKIIYSLNTSLPTESFQNHIDREATCRNLFQQLQVGHKQRECAIKACILESAKKVVILKQEREGNYEDVALSKKFKNEQCKLRLLQSELAVEGIIKERSYKAFNERCRNFYKDGLIL